MDHDPVLALCHVRFFAVVRHIPPHPRNLTVPVFVNLTAGDPPQPKGPLTPSPDGREGGVNGLEESANWTEPVTHFCRSDVGRRRYQVMNSVMKAWSVIGLIFAAAIFATIPI